MFSAATLNRRAAQRGGGGGKGGNFPRAPGLRGSPKGNFRDWKGSPRGSFWGPKKLWAALLNRVSYRVCRDQLNPSIVGVEIPH